MSDLHESMGRLKAANIVIAMLHDGRERIGIAGTQRMFEAQKMGAAIWTPEEMLKYCEMSKEERDVFRGLKQTFKAAAEFKEAE